MKKDFTTTLFIVVLFFGLLGSVAQAEPPRKIILKSPLLPINSTASCHILNRTDSILQGMLWQHNDYHDNNVHDLGNIQLAANDGTYSLQTANTSTIGEYCTVTYFGQPGDLVGFFCSIADNGPQSCTILLQVN